MYQHVAVATVGSSISQTCWLFSSFGLVRSIVVVVVGSPMIMMMR